MKKSIIPVAAFIAGMAIVPSVFADTSDVADDGTIKDWTALEKCLSGSEAGLSNADTCILGADFSVDVAGAKLGEKNITLDLNGHKLTNTNNGNFIETGKGSFTIIGNGNSAIESAGAIVNVAGEGAFTLAEGATLKGASPVLVSAKDTAVNVTINGTLEDTGAGYAIGTNSDAKKANVAVNGVVKSEKGYGVKQYAGTVTLNGAKVEAGTGLYIEGGKLAVEDSEIEANGAKSSALWVHSTAAAKNVESINIEGSSLASKDGYAIYVNGDTSNGKEALGDFILNNVKLTAKDANTYVMAKSDSENNKPGFANYLVDGKDYTALKLTETLGSYESPAEQGDDEPAADTEGDKTENPNTADTIATYMTIAAVALLGLGATAFVAKKSNR